MDVALKAEWAKRLVEGRRKASLTQKEVADLLNVDQGTVSRWERGMDPSVDHKRGIARLYGIEARNLFPLDA